MSRTMIVSCGGQIVTVERRSDGKIVFHDYDLETDMAMEALGMEPSPCIQMRQAILEEQKEPGSLNQKLLNIVYDERLDDILEKLPLLIFVGADINAGDGSAIADSSQQSRYTLIRALVKMGANPNAENGVALRTAISENQYDLMEFLLDHGANPDIKGGLPLGIAVELNDPRAARILLFNGSADPQVNDNILMTLAINTGSIDMFDLLLSAGASLPSDGLHLDHDSTATPEIITRVFEEFELTADERRTALEEAVSNGRLDLVEVLLQNGVPLEPYDEEIVEMARDADMDEIADLIERWIEDM